MNVSDIMAKEVSACYVNDDVESVAGKMKRFNVGFMPVVDDYMALKGVVTDRDIVMYMADHKEDLDEVSLRELTNSRPLYTCNTDDNVKVALDIMKDNQLHRLPVVNKKGILKGIIRLADIVSHTDISDKYYISPDEALKTVKGIYEQR